MSHFIIQGPTKLKGEVEPAGAKNASLKQIAACLLTNQEVILHNLPKILDVENMLFLVEKLGCQIEWSDSHTAKICCKRLSTSAIDAGLAGKMRASTVLIGPLLARLGKAELPAAGGDKIGRRPIDTHLNGFKKLGVKVNRQKDRYIFNISSAKAAAVFLDEMSVTATENLILLATLLPGQTILRGAAAEPEIEDLALMLRKMGAKIAGAGTHTVIIQGVKRLSGCEHTVVPDRIEIGTLACGIIASAGEGVIKNVILEHIENLLSKLEKMGVEYKFNLKSQISNLKITSQNAKLFNRTWGNLILKPSPNLTPIFIDTRPYPGFPTDLQAVMALLLTQARGQSRIFETLFEGRLGYARQLNKMGAQIKTLDEHNIIIQGPSKLQGAEIQTSDIRAGAALVLAGLIAEGKTTVKNIEILERGYENLEGKLQSLGAKISRVQ